jgi:hypothetical protein
LGNPAQALPPAAEPQEPDCPIYIPSVLAGRLWQGEILQDIVQLKATLESIQNPNGEIEILTVNHDFAVVMTQDCDLLKDFNRREAEQAGTQPNVLFCDLYHAAVLKAKINEETPIGRREWKLIAQNLNERFQYLQRMEPGDDLQATGMPALAIDFRLYFTIPTDELYHRLTQEIHRRARLNSPYIEHLAQRFFKFQARVALPSDHAVDPIVEG